MNPLDGTTAVLYARVSTRDQTNDNQLIRLRSLALSRGYEVVRRVHRMSPVVLTLRGQSSAKC